MLMMKSHFIRTYRYDWFLRLLYFGEEFLINFVLNVYIGIRTKMTLLVMRNVFVREDY